MVMLVPLPPMASRMVEVASNLHHLGFDRLHQASTSGTRPTHAKYLRGHVQVSVGDVALVNGALNASDNTN